MRRETLEEGEGGAVTYAVPVTFVVDADDAEEAYLYVARLLCLARDTCVLYAADLPLRAATVAGLRALTWTADQNAVQPGAPTDDTEGVEQERSAR